MKAVLVPAQYGEPIKDIELPDNAQLAADAIRHMIGGYMERVKLRDCPTVSMWVDEDGKMKSVTRNLRATFLSSVEPPDFIVGDAIITGGRGALGRDCGWSAKNFESMLSVQRRRGLPDPDPAEMADRLQQRANQILALENDGMELAAKLGEAEHQLQGAVSALESIANAQPVVVVSGERPAINGFTLRQIARDALARFGGQSA